jgi:hypothetical protein
MAAPISHYPPSPKIWRPAHGRRPVLDRDGPTTNSRGSFPFHPHHKLPAKVALDILLNQYRWVSHSQSELPKPRSTTATCDVAGLETKLTVRIVTHSQRKRGATDRLNLRKRRQSSTPPLMFVYYAQPCTP